MNINFVNFAPFRQPYQASYVISNECESARRANPTRNLINFRCCLEACKRKGRESSIGVYKIREILTRALIGR